MKRAVPLNENYVVIDGCWIWKGSLDRNGYPQMSRSGKTYRAHRFYYAHIKNINMNNSLQLDHKCKNIKCVNPDHMEEVTQHENLRRAGMLKLTSQQVMEIRNAYWGGREKQKDLAERYGVLQQHISRIVNHIDRKTQ
jgi:hypothetical protein